MGRAGIEPATHGFSDSQPLSGNDSRSNDLELVASLGAAQALHFKKELVEITRAWAQLSPFDRRAVLAIVRAHLKGKSNV